MKHHALYIIIDLHLVLNNNFNYMNEKRKFSMNTMNTANQTSFYDGIDKEIQDLYIKEELNAPK
jgi:hypothetical protein